MSKPVIIFDTGSYNLKAGLSTEEKPACIIPTLIGRSIYQITDKNLEVELKPLMLGEELIPVRSFLKLSYPMKAGIIQNEEDMAILWNYCIKEKLGITDGDLKDRKVMLTESPLNPTENKQKMAEILFEKMGVGFFNIEPKAKLTLYSFGSETGVVIDSGDEATYVVPIASGCLLQYLIKKLNIAGRYITENLIRLLQLNPHNPMIDFDTAREMKEKYCFVSCDYEGDKKLVEETSYYNSIHKLPDGRKINISSEKFRATEILFDPKKVYSKQDGIHKMVFDAIMDSDLDHRKDFFNNIILTGGTTMFAGFTSRIKKEVRHLRIKYENYKSSVRKKNKLNVEIIEDPLRKYSEFIGATVLAEIYNKDNSISNYWITKAEWEEYGKNIILKKCAYILREKKQ